ncbi:hypothetical protein [Pseudaminobacter sp. NGMCC 1.201702]|uniref:hypothetical protein n=1 Tax=Pseudaminobacter sp. NGMCC 1.201702 TaxID=3391825 RepID=UPI0039EEE55F
MRALISRFAIAVVTTAIICGPVNAQEMISDRDVALSAFANDVGQLQASIPTAQAYMAMKAGELDSWWEELIKKARNMKERWADNPYVSVTGFSLSLSIPPSIDVEFEFKS